MTSLYSSLAPTTFSPLHYPKKPPSSAPRRRFYTTCSSRKNTANTTDTSNADHNNGKRSERSSESGSVLRLDRRNVLLGLGGLYGASTLRGNMAVGAPIVPPDLSKCQLADGGEGAGEVQCCPPYGSDATIIDYEFPSSSKPLRVRRPAHLLETEEIEKYKEGIAKMRELTTTDPDDPRGWMQQANVHCQFCNGAFEQLGFDDALLQMHFSWLFVPWHRWYLHFYERILGSLIGDDTFAIPFWNWDTEAGMQIPSIFADTTSSLYDENRNLSHLPPAVMDFYYSYGDALPSTEEGVQNVVNNNLLWISTTYKESLALPELFMGDPVRAGETVSDSTNSAGGLETIHNTMHQWTGPDPAPYMNMGNFFSAGRDPIFFSHHSNVDRMWQIYRSMRGNKTEFEDTDWLDASFIFVDENKQLNRVKVSDCFNPLKLKYTYEEVELPWAATGIITKLRKATKTKTTTDESTVSVSEFGSDPIALDTTIRVLVTRPEQSRSKTDKEEAVETLVISGIQAPIFKPSRFDVYVTLPSGDGVVGSDLGEKAGSFVKLPHHGGDKDTSITKTKNTKLKLGITSLLEDIDAEAAEKVVVSLVPRLGEVTVGGVSIELLSTSGS